jgi:hypothetical protein
LSPILAHSDDIEPASIDSKLTETEIQWLDQTQIGIADFLQDLLTRKTQSQQDYLEFLKLSLIILNKIALVTGGEWRRLHFSSRGAYHRTSWLAKAIYYSRSMV